MDETLADPATGAVSPLLLPLANGLKQMKRANSGLTWIRQPHVQAFLRTLASTTATHDAIDALPTSPTREFVRGLLVEHGALPRRDAYLATFNEWLKEVPERLSNRDDRDVLLRYIRWNHLRKMHESGPVSRGLFLRSKQTITVAVDFLNWLADRQVNLSDLSQSDLDDWVTGGTSTRLIADRFLNWARRSRLVNTDLRIAVHRRGTAERLSLVEQRRAHTALAGPGPMNLRDRAAGVLVLVFGQLAEDIVRLTWRDVVMTESKVSIRIGGIWMPMPPPFDELWRKLHTETRNKQTAAHPNSDWVFLGQKPGQPINPGYLTTRLRKHLKVRAARLGALNELTKLAPIAIAAEALGYSTLTLEKHAIDSGSTYARYIGNVRAVSHSR